MLAAIAHGKPNSTHQPGGSSWDCLTGRFGTKPCTGGYMEPDGSTGQKKSTYRFRAKCLISLLNFGGP